MNVLDCDKTKEERTEAINRLLGIKMDKIFEKCEICLEFARRTIGFNKFRFKYICMSIGLLNLQAEGSRTRISISNNQINLLGNRVFK